MSYVTLEHVKRALAGLAGRPHLAVVTLPALLRAAVQQGVDPLDPAGISFSNEGDLLRTFFEIPRPHDSRKPYLSVWNPDPKIFVADNYATSGLQRSRTDEVKRGRIFSRTKVKGASDRWWILPAAGADLRDDWEAKHGSQLSEVRMIDLAIWFGREQEVADLSELLDWWKSEFSPDHGDLVGTIFIDDIPSDYASLPMSDAPLSSEDYVELGSLPEALAVSESLVDLVASLQARITASGFLLPDGMVRRVLTSWLRGDLVVLTGQPGTGKTRFATAMAAAMRVELGLTEEVLIAVGSDFDESEFLGYEGLDGKPKLRQFATEVLQTDSPLEPRIVILEEFNLAVVESYFSSILVALQESSRGVALPAGGHEVLPVDAFFIATCNSYRDEPETRTRMSAPAKRRSTVITMPNVLWTRVLTLRAGAEDPGLAELLAGIAVGLIKDEADRVRERVASDHASSFDEMRLAALDSVTRSTDLSDEARERLALIAKALLTTPEGRSWFTLGILRDLALALALADRTPESELQALADSVADKLLHQVRGPHSNADLLVEAVADLPGTDEIKDLAERLKDSGAFGEVLPLL